MGKKLLHTSNDSGFTLFEVLVSVIIISLIFVLATQIIHINATVNNKVNELDDFKKKNNSINFIVQAIKYSKPFRILKDNKIYFVGKENEVKLLSSYSQQSNFQGIHFYHIFTTNTSVRNLVVEQKVFRSFISDEQKQLTRTVIVRDICSFGLQYQDRFKNWHKTWQFPHHLPDLVRLQLKVGSCRSSSQHERYIYPVYR